MVTPDREALIAAARAVVDATVPGDGFTALREALAAEPAEELTELAREIAKDWNGRELDTAWAAAEAALPADDWDMAVYRMGREPRLRESRRLYAATASSPHDPVTRSWSIVSSEEGRDRDTKQDTTPAAALLALVARLRESR